MEKNILLQSDNSTTVAHINNQGGTISGRLLDITQNILLKANALNSPLTATHIPGRQNILADALSRMKTVKGEWCLHPEIYQSLVRRWGPPSIDLFASIANHQTSRFKTIEEDGLSADLTDETLVYAFPPSSLIQRLLEKIDRTKSLEMILITPFWPARPWFPVLRKLAAFQDPVNLQDIECPSLYQTVQGETLWANPSGFQPVAWRLSKPSPEPHHQ